MEFRTIVLWELINEKECPGMTGQGMTIEAYMPLVDALFPGINYYSITGFGQVMRRCVVPALRKLYPELLTSPAEEIEPEAMTEVATVMPSAGYEWQESAEWRSRFEKFLTAA